MTPKEIQAAAQAFKRSLGPQADLFVKVDLHGDEPAGLRVYPDGIVGDLAIEVFAADWQALFERAPQQLAAHISARRSRIVKAMALAIVEITYDRGDCTDNALRMTGKFTTAQIRELAEDACKVADSMGQGGPFAVIHSEANAA